MGASHFFLNSTSSYSIFGSSACLLLDVSAMNAKKSVGEIYYDLKNDHFFNKYVIIEICLKDIPTLDFYLIY